MSSKPSLLDDEVPGAVRGEHNDSASPQPVDGEAFRMAYQTKLEFKDSKQQIPMRLDGAKTDYAIMSGRRHEMQRKISRTLSCI